jgi:hypothetical protein
MLQVILRNAYFFGQRVTTFIDILIEPMVRNSNQTKIQNCCTETGGD